MVVEKFNINSALLQYHIENTIRVFKDYRLDKKIPQDGWLRVWSGITYYDYTMQPTDEGTELQIVAGRAATKISEDQSNQHAFDFLNNLNKIVAKEIVITPEIANVDPYKTVSSGQALVQIISLIIALIAIFYGIKAFMM